VNNLREASLLEKAGNPAGALAKYRNAYSYIDKLSRADPGDKGHRRGLAITYLEMGDVLRQLRQTRQALDNYSKAIAISEALLADDPNKGETRADLANMYTHAGALYLNSGDLARAAHFLDKGRAFFRQSPLRDPDAVQMQRDQAELSARLGELYSRLRQWPQARDAYQSSLTIWKTLGQRNLLRRMDRAKPDELARAVEQSSNHVP
jgi:tetratricopeptide (TPR) repeat protein